MFKLNFFKSTELQSHKMANKSSFSITFWGMFFVIACTYLLYNPRQQTIDDSKLKPGDIAKKEIIVKKDLTVEDTEATEQKRQQEIKNVIPIYEHYTEKKKITKNLLNEWFTWIRDIKKKYLKNQNELEDIKKELETRFAVSLTSRQLKNLLASNILHKIDLNNLFVFIDSIYDGKILISKIGARKSKNNTIKIVSKTSEPRIFSVNNLYDLKDVEGLLTQALRNQNLQNREINILSPLIMEFIDVNIAYSQNLTKEEEQKVSSQILPVLIKLKAGKVLLRKGDDITPADIKLIKLIAKAEQIQSKKLSKVFLILAILTFLFIFLEKFFRVWKSDTINKEKLFIVSGATLTISALVYKVSIFLFPLILKNIPLNITIEPEGIFYAIPFGFGALIIAFIFNLQSAVVFSFVNAIFGGIALEWNFHIFLYILISNLAASYGIEYYQRIKRSPIFKASIFWLFPANIFFIFIFNLTEPSFLIQQTFFLSILGFISAVISPIIASFIIPLWEMIFNLITELKLIELANLNLPIFREMLEKAPGTYHHSQMVSSLSETAAIDLGLSPLLLTTKALYHDIGKIENPQFFTENQSIYKNPHEKLTPRESAKNIIAHISDGLELAEKIKLPEVITSAISEHHGTKVVRFFYDKAREMSSVDTDEFADKDFRYQGQKPQTIENGIIMLADQVEAASKTMASPTEEEIKNVIQQVININIDENQFDECKKLTFEALNVIANSFHKKLSSIYHMRVSYPGFDFTEKKENGKNNKNNH